MADYLTFTTTRTTDPDAAQLLAQLRAIDATIGVQRIDLTHYVLKKNTTWTAPQITSAQNVLDSAPDLSAQRSAQGLIDQMSLYDKARDLATIDALNVLRAFHSLAAITPAQALAAIRNKAGTL